MSDAARLETIVRANPGLATILDRFDELALPDSYLVAGAVAQTVWNQAHGVAPEYGIKDLDIVYFDPGDLSAACEASHERRLEALLHALTPKLDVKNQARVHLWYEDVFGNAIDPYRSAADAIASFPTTATAIGVRMHQGRFDVCAPFGLDDLLGLVVRPNRRQVTGNVYAAKTARWQALWPRLTILPWDVDRSD